MNAWDDPFFAWLPVPKVGGGWLWLCHVQAVTADYWYSSIDGGIRFRYRYQRQRAAQAPEGGRP